MEDNNTAVGVDKPFKNTVFAVRREPNKIVLVIDCNSTNRFGTGIRDYYDEPLMWILLGMYLLFTNILLLNLLIAVFNNTYTEVQAKASQIWAFKRYQIILEYSQRHGLFAPISLLGFLTLLIRWLYRKVTGYVSPPITGFRSRVTAEQIEDLVEFECMCMTKWCKSKTTSISKSLEETTSDILDEIDNMKSDMVIIKDKLQNATMDQKEGIEEDTSPLSRFSSIVTRRISTQTQPVLGTK